MNILEFLKSKIVFIIFQILLSIFIIMLLSLYNISYFGICLLIFSIIILTLFEIAYEYLTKNNFYKTLSKTISKLDKKYYISELIEEPNFIEGEIMVKTLKETCKSMNDQIALYKLANKQYKDYIETWVHEIKLPIASIDLMCENNVLKNKDIKLEIQRINDHVEQALYYAKSTNIEEDYIIKSIDLSKFIKGIIKNNSNRLIDNKVKIELKSLNHKVYSDTKWLEFIINQILSNSIKYKKIDSKIIITALNKENQVVLSIKDNGVGIENSDLNKIFNKGYTGINGRKFSKSTGMGLYLCKNLCEKMFLGINIKSEINKYTEVLLTFPKNKDIFIESK